MAELARPGVEIQQVVETASPTILIPSLVPCVVAPCYHVVDALTSDGTVNTSARAGDYQNNLGEIAYNFPTLPAESNIDPGSVEVYLESGSSADKLNGDGDEVVLETAAGAAGAWSYVSGTNTLTVVAPATTVLAGDVFRVSFGPGVTQANRGPLAELTGTEIVASGAAVADATVDLVVVSGGPTAYVVQAGQDWGYDLAGGAGMQGWQLVRNAAQYTTAGGTLTSRIRLTSGTTATDNQIDIQAILGGPGGVADGSLGDSISFTFVDDATTTASLATITGSPAAGWVVTVSYNGPLGANNTTWALVAAELQTKGLALNLFVCATPASGSGAANVGAPNTIRATDAQVGPTIVLDGGADANTLVLDSNLLNTLYGIPITSTTVGHPVVEYIALRQDVTAAAASPALQTFESISEMTAAIGPVDTRNPLALMCYLALLNSPTSKISALGIDTVGVAPFEEGTVAAYVTALDYLSSKEVYAIAPLSQAPQVHQILSAHVTALSAASEKHERIGLISRQLPTTQQDTVVLSGTSGILENPSANWDVLQFDNTWDFRSGDIFSIAGALATDPATAGDVLVVDTFTGDVVLGNGYEGAAIDGAGGGPPDDVVTMGTGGPATVIDATLPDNQNDIEGVTWTLYSPGAAITTRGQEVAAVAGYSETFANRRIVHVWAPQVTVTVGTSQQLLGGGYACAAVAGQIGQQPVNQPHTNLNLVGLDAVSATNARFSESQLNEISGGGTYILIQEVLAGPVFCRHQNTTDVSTLEFRELSITKVLDYLAKYFRGVLTPFIGKFNITSGYIDTIGSLIEGHRSSLVARGVVADIKLNSLQQNTTLPDSLDIDLSVSVYYPANYIRVKLII